MKPPRRRFRAWTWSHRLTALAFMALLVLGTFQAFPWFKGSVTATTLFDYVPLGDPLAALENMLASRTIDGTLLIGALILVVLALIMGPVFCGWLCPLGLLLDLNNDLRQGLVKSARRFGSTWFELGLPRVVKFAVLGGALGFSLYAHLPAFQTLSPINFTAWLVAFCSGSSAEADAGWMADCAGWVSSAASAGGFLLCFLAFLVILEYLAPRIWCRALCPAGGLYNLLSRFAVFKVRVKAQEACAKACRECVIHCPLGIAVKDDFVRAKKSGVDHGDCTRCGACVDQCPHNVLGMGFGGAGRLASKEMKDA